jgi:hypothetical protein
MKLISCGDKYIFQTKRHTYQSIARGGENTKPPKAGKQVGRLKIVGHG